MARGVFRLLVALYPRGFRRRFGDRMMEDFRRMRAEERATGSRGWVAFWYALAVDTAVGAIREHRDARRGLGREGRVSGGGGDAWAALVPDVRIAVRTLSRRPVFSVVAIGTLALAIGANTALFSVLHGVLLRPLPYPDADRLALLSESEGSWGNVSYPNYLDWRERAASFDEMGTFSWTEATLTGGDEPMRVIVGRADPPFMELAGLLPTIGRSLLPEDDRPGAPRVAVLSHGLWQQSFGGSVDVLGTTISLDGTPTTVVGVLGAGLDFAETGTALWVPIVPNIGNWVERREVHALTVLGRLRPDVDIATARGDFEQLGAAMAVEYAESNAGRGARLRLLHRALLGDVSRAVWLLMGMAGTVLLIACANLASLLLARMTARKGELAVRRTLGASRWDVTRLFLVEGLVLTLMGGALGVALAYAATVPTARLIEGSLPRIDNIGLDGTVLLFALALSIGTGIAFGLLPGLVRVQSRDARRHGRAGPDRKAAALRASLSAAQIAGTVILLVGSGLMVRSFERLQSVDVGFDPDNLGTIAVSLAGAGRQSHEVIQFYQDLPRALEDMPSIESAAAVNALPISGGDANGTVTIDGRPFELGDEPTASFRRVTPGYFETVGTPVLFGRDFNGTDDGTHMVTIINHEMADRLWTDPSDAIGARIKVGSPEYEPWLTVVGVVGDVRNVGLDTEPRFATYEPHPQRPWTTMSVVYRARDDLANATSAVREAVQASGGEVPVYNFTTLNDRISASLGPRRLALALTSIFAALTLLIASIGVYGLLTYSVEQRMAELGLRLALGARGEQLFAYVAGQATRVVGVGLALGIIGAVVVAQTLQSLLYEVDRLDGVTFLSAVVAIAAVGAIACFVPARRAATIDPADSLRRD